MNINDLIEKYFKDPDNENLLFESANENEISLLEKELECNLPSDYKKFLLSTNGFEGYIGDNYLILESVNNIIENTKDIFFEDYKNWAIFIGSNGANEMFIIDKSTEPYSYNILPFIGNENDLIKLETKFDKFIERFFNDNLFEKLQ